MNEKKTHLVKSLKLAIDALKNDTIKYKWESQSSCNAGVVSQAILGVSAEELEKLREPLFDKLTAINQNLNNNEKKIDMTWKNAIKNVCPITGKNMPQIIVDLEGAGIGRSDIVHLEYLENPAILELSGIEKIKTFRNEKISETKELVTVPHENWFKRLFGATTTIEVVEPVYEKKLTGEAYPERYYSKKENLIKYLIAWVKILEGNTTHETTSNELEAKLLNAVAEENYEEAAKLRDQLLLV